MNLFVQSLSDYVTQAWHDEMARVGGPSEARFVIESMDARFAIDLLGALDAYRLRRITDERDEECYFKVATGLWESWQVKQQRDQLVELMSAKNGIADDDSLTWVDEEDRLTWYRSRTKADNRDGLIIVLIGLSNATDQGGLKDFHIVDEERIWRFMGRSFMPWIEALVERYDLQASESDKENLDKAFNDLFKVRPRRLSLMAEFIETDLIDAGTAGGLLSDLLVRFYQKLPAWDIPPIFGVSPRGSNLKDLIKDAEAFISHQWFKSGLEQSRALQKIEKLPYDDSFVQPECLDATLAYADITDLVATIKSFISAADAVAKTRLMQTDVRQIISALKKKEKDEDKNTKEKAKPLTGSSVEAFLKGVWSTLLQYQKKSQGAALVDTLEAVTIEVQTFHHDLAVRSGEDGNSDREDDDAIAKEMLRCCLGGIETLFASTDCKLPSDGDEMLLPLQKWQVPLTIDLQYQNATFRTSRKRPHIAFVVRLLLHGGSGEFKQFFQWSFDANHAERVRYLCARSVLEGWPANVQHRPVLPAFRMATEALAALYYSADEEEANRLLSQALTEMKVIDLVSEVPQCDLAVDLWSSLRDLSEAYRGWLLSYVSNGYFNANLNYYSKLQTAYIALADRVLNQSLNGAKSLLRRFYKAFLILDASSDPAHEYIRSAAIWGVTPAVIELTQARDKFLCDSFPEILAQQVRGKNGRAAFERLLGLVKIRRPLAGIVIDQNKNISAQLKSFNLIHHLGEQPPPDRSLAVQTLLREQDAEVDDDDVSDLTRETEEGTVVKTVLHHYMELYPFAEDGIRVLAVHLEDLAAVLSGVDKFLREYMPRTAADLPPFQCEVVVYSTSTSPMVIERRLAAWREDVLGRCREEWRELVVTVGHHFAPTPETMKQRLTAEKRLYDIAFLFQFLAKDLSGEAASVQPFDFDYNEHSVNSFPITEYPRPIQKSDSLTRQSLLSNHRLEIQTHHGEMTARLRHSGNASRRHLIYGRVNYRPWQAVVDEMHSKAQWVACVDQFVDKRLIEEHRHDHPRKIVGFTSGLGSFGELNLAISTQQDTLSELTHKVRSHLKGLLPFSSTDSFEAMATQVIEGAEEVIGLSSLRAVVGKGEKVREVIGFAAIQKMLKPSPEAVMTQLLPVDSLGHWFAGAEVNLRPDLLQLGLVLRAGDIPIIDATVMECKFALHNEEHLAEAIDQTHDGLTHLTALLAPNRKDVQGLTFDRRYWWAQLQRAMTSRSVVSMPETELEALEAALQQIADGYYEIRWQAAVVTFWTDVEGPHPIIQKVGFEAGAVRSPYEVPAGFAVQHVALGYKGLISLFNGNGGVVDLRAGCRPVAVRAMVTAALAEDPSHTSVAGGRDSAEAVDTSSSNCDIELSGQNSTPVAAATFQGPDEPAPRDSKSLAASRLGEPIPAIHDAAGSGSARLHASTLGNPAPGEGKQSDDFLVIVEQPPGNAATAEVAVPLPVETISASVPSVIEFALPPPKLLIGKKSNGAPVYWNYGHPQLANRHLIIFGSSGFGKTYTIQCLLAEMASSSLRSLIIDYTDGFAPAHVEKKFKEVARPADHFIKVGGLPLSPFQPQRMEIDPSMPPILETPYEIATRIASIFTSVYSNMGDQQTAALIKAIREGVSGNAAFSLEDLLATLLSEDSNSAQSLASKIEPFVEAKPFGQKSNSAWKNLLTSPDHFVHVLQLKGLARDIQRLVTEFALWNLYDYATNHGSKHRPIPVVLDEIQNLDHRSDSPIDKMLREGRKFGLSLILATQTASQFDQEAKDRLFQAGHKLFFRPSDTELGKYAELLSSANTGTSKQEWAGRLAALNAGQCWSLGPVVTTSGAFRTEAVLVNITSLEERFPAGA